jgi:hypothetical protein
MKNLISHNLLPEALARFSSLAALIRLGVIVDVTAAPDRQLGRPALRAPPAALRTPAAVDQGLTLVHLSAQRKRFWWDKYNSGGG